MAPNCEHCNETHPRMAGNLLTNQATGRLVSLLRSYHRVCT
jgi:hypothetical protein